MWAPSERPATPSTLRTALQAKAQWQAPDKLSSGLLVPLLLVRFDLVSIREQARSSRLENRQQKAGLQTRRLLRRRRSCRSKMRGQRKQVRPSTTISKSTKSYPSSHPISCRQPAVRGAVRANCFSILGPCAHLAAMKHGKRATRRRYTLGWRGLANNFSPSTRYARCRW